MVKKIWKIVQYVMLAMQVLVMVMAMFLGDLRMLFKSILYISFWVSMILKDVLPNKLMTLRVGILINT